MLEHWPLGRKCLELRSSGLALVIQPALVLPEQVLGLELLGPFLELEQELEARCKVLAHRRRCTQS